MSSAVVGVALLGSIPSPSTSAIEIGPLRLNIYGLCIALGVVAAVWLMGRRMEAKGVGTSDDAGSLAVWGVVAGVIGARLYHVATDFDKFENDLLAIPRLWEGGLGIPGGLALGIPAGLYAARKRNLPLGVIANCAAPAIALAQAIGRWGNYFNQELFGRPTNLPWALEIDPDNAPEFAAGTTFHPTFLYESLWSLALCVVLLRIDVKFRIGPGQLMALYVAGYGLGRFWVEGLRIDQADEVAGLRWNQWVAIAAIVGGIAVFTLLRRKAAAAAGGVADAAGGSLDGERADPDELSDPEGFDDADESDDSDEAFEDQLDADVEGVDAGRSGSAEAATGGSPDADGD